MGEHADQALNDAMGHEINYQSYLNGDLSEEEAYDLGLIDEWGASPNELVNSSLNLGVMDVSSLENELYKCDAQLRSIQKPRTVVHYWRSGAELMLPKDMSKQHLINAIAYAKHNNMNKDPIFFDMVSELKKRTG